MNLMREKFRRIGVVTGSVLGAIAVGVFVVGITAPSTASGPMPNSATAPIDLLTDPEPVALVKVSGVKLYAIELNLGGKVCIPSCPPTPPQSPTALEADVAFVVVDLDSGKIAGGMLADPPTGSTFSLSVFGTVTTWTGPTDFATLRGPIDVEPIDSPAITSGATTTTVAGGA